MEQREQRKKLMMQERLASNGTVDDFWKSYYRYYKPDLNTTTQNDKKYRRKPFQLDLQLKTKRKKQQKQINSVLPNESFDISTSMPTTTVRPLTTFVTVETTTAGITKSTDELQSNNREENTTSEINSKIHINDRMNLNETTTNKINEITSTTTTTEHSITYNVTADNPKGVQPANNRSKVRKLSNAIWGKWQKWTKCSRSCGGGVMSQSRLCLSR